MKKLTSFSLFCFAAFMSASQANAQIDPILNDHRPVSCTAICNSYWPDWHPFADIRLTAKMPDGSKYIVDRAEWPSRASCRKAVLEGGFQAPVCRGQSDPLRCDIVVLTSGSFINNPNHLVFEGPPEIVRCP